MSNVAEKSVIAKLLSESSITGLVGTRVYPRLAPQGSDGGAKPYLIVLRPEGQENPTASTGLTGVSFTPIIIACVGADYDESRTLSQPVIDVLSPSGWNGSQTWGTTQVGSCQLNDTFDRSSLPQLADEIGAPVEFIAFDLEHSSV